MITLLGLNLEELQTLCAEEGLPRYTARQMADWLYAKRVCSIDEMTNLSLNARNRLKGIALIGRHAPVYSQESKDGTRKYLFEVSGSASQGEQSNTRTIETVYIPDADRATLCVSCQAGCKMGCRFCVTGQQGFHGHLTAADILNQTFECMGIGMPLTNIVFMGMGEPMDNLEAVLRATQVLTAPWGLGWSPHRITVSTVGLIPGIKRFLDESQCHLAVSLHNPFADERLALMPVQQAYPIAEVVDLLRLYDWSGQRRVSFEYTLFNGLNDDIRHADALLRLLRGLRCRVNLIRFHSSPGTPYRTSTPEAIARFQNHLTTHGLTCTLRASRGEDIMAACGLLGKVKG